MKQILSFLVLLQISLTCFGQPCSFINGQLAPRCGRVFDQSAYPPDSFIVQRREYSLGETLITLTLLGHSYDADYYSIEKEACFQVWLEQREGSQLIRSEYFGCEEGENYFQILSDVHPGYVLFNSQGEFSGTLYMIDDQGAWYTMEGCLYYYVKEDSTIYSLVPEECGGCTIGKFNLHSHELISKQSNGRDMPWEEYPVQKGSQVIFDLDVRVTWEMNE